MSDELYKNKNNEIHYNSSYIDEEQNSNGNETWSSQVTHNT